MPYKQIGETKKYVGLSTDVKPTKVDTGDEFLEYDTGQIYIQVPTGAWMIKE